MITISQQIHSDGWFKTAFEIDNQIHNQIFNQVNLIIKTYIEHQLWYPICSQMIDQLNNIVIDQITHQLKHHEYNRIANK